MGGVCVYLRGNLLLTRFLQPLLSTSLGHTAPGSSSLNPRPACPGRQSTWPQP